jgi:hypothetical protein
VILSRFVGLRGSPCRSILFLKIPPRLQTCRDDLDRPAAVDGVDGGFGKWPVRAGVGRPVRASLASSPQRKGDVQLAEGDYRRDSEPAGGRDQHGRGELSLHQLHQLLNRQKRSAQQ